MNGATAANLLLPHQRFCVKGLGSIRVWVKTQDALFGVNSLLLGPSQKAHLGGRGVPEF